MQIQVMEFRRAPRSTPYLILAVRYTNEEGTE